MSAISTYRHHELRRKAVHFLGGTCALCTESEISKLFVTPLPGLTWSDVYGPDLETITSIRKKYEWLQKHYWPTKLVRLVCTMHYIPPPSPVSAALQNAAKQRRDAEHQAVIEAYGGECVHCGQTEPEKLMVDTTLDRGNSWRRLLGPHRKEQRERRLIQAKFPDGVRVRCRPDAGGCT